MRRVALLTTSLGPDYVTDDHLVVPLLAERGIEASFVRWREYQDWTIYDLVVVRSTWDYQRHLDDFLGTLATIAAATRLENPLHLQRWNVRKTYLQDLASEGIPVVPTVWSDGLAAGDLARLLREVGTGDVVLKPVVGASGEDAFRIPPEGAADQEQELLATFDGRPLMIQPFLSAVLEVGEISVVWIDGEVSHALRKVPRRGEFRSQEEHGGIPKRIALEPALSSAAAAVAEAVARRSPRSPLYGRVDFLPGPDGWLVGELELVEPSLYLRLDPGAARRLADAILRRVEHAEGIGPG